MTISALKFFKNTKSFTVPCHHRNPYYEYVSQSPLFNQINNNINTSGIYSKEAPFLISPSGDALFVYDENTSPTSVGFNYAAPISTNWNELNTTIEICLHPYNTNSYILEEDEEIIKPTEEKVNDAKIYPNPNNGEVLKISFDFPEEELVSIDLYNMNGELLQSLPVLKEKSSHHQMYLNNYEPGIYLLKIHSKNHQVVKKLIIQ